MRLAVSSTALSNFLWFYCQEHQSFCSNVPLPLDASICCLQRLKTKNSDKLIVIPAQRLSIENFTEALRCFNMQQKLQWMKKNS